MKILLGILIIAVFIIFLHNTSPYVNSGDSGEFITTSYILGIAHSPGYPLYSVIGKIFSFIIPFGNYAYRINIMNVLFSVFILIIFVLFISNFVIDKLKIFVSMFIFLIFLFSEPYFRNTVQTEVFVLNIFFALLLLCFSYKEIKKSSFKNWYMISFLFGLSLGNHHTIVFLLPSIIYLFFVNRIKIKMIFIFFLFFMLGFSIYLMLPLRAAKDPYFNWGNPKSLVNLYNVIIRKDYGTFQLTVEKKNEYNIRNISVQISRFFKRTIRDLGIFLLFLIFFSFVKIYFSNKKLFFYLILMYLISGLGFLILSNLPYSDIYEGILERFYILPNFVGIFSIVLSIIYFDEKFLKIPLIIVLILLLNKIFNNFHICNYREYYLNYDYGINILRTLPKNSFLFMDGGDDTFYTLGYMQAVERRRLDVRLHDRGGLVFRNIYGKDFRSLTKEEKEERRIIVEKSLINKFPVFYSTFNRNILPNIELKYAGVLYVVESQFVSNLYNKDIFKQIYSYRSLYHKYYDYRSKALVPIYLFMEAVNETDIRKKISILKLCYFLWKEVDWLKNNILIELHNEAYKAFNQGDIQLSKDIYELILKINPKDTSALLNLGVIFENLNEISLAEEYYNRVIEIAPYNSTAYYNLGVLYWKQSKWDKVIEYFNKALALQPDNYQIKYYINRAIEEKKKNDVK
ncbi:MAG: DUF2723 domain-containing protein [Elusimicrobiota bacterium]|nr:DUF2723 domain-containing protein [Endomicrobiia bacterium]MDW8165066.1 DUF2723 domain-containing protein [Elusimicrobiota bacterium]